MEDGVAAVAAAAALNASSSLTEAAGGMDLSSSASSAMDIALSTSSSSLLATTTTRAYATAEQRRSLFTSSSSNVGRLAVRSPSWASDGRCSDADTSISSSSSSSSLSLSSSSSSSSKRIRVESLQGEGRGGSSESSVRLKLLAFSPSSSVLGASVEEDCGGGGGGNIISQLPSKRRWYSVPYYPLKTLRHLSGPFVTLTCRISSAGDQLLYVEGADAEAPRTLEDASALITTYFDVGALPAYTRGSLFGAMSCDERRRAPYSPSLHAGMFNVKRLRDVVFPVGYMQWATGHSAPDAGALRYAGALLFAPPNAAQRNDLRNRETSMLGSLAWEDPAWFAGRASYFGEAEPSAETCLAALKARALRCGGIVVEAFGAPEASADIWRRAYPALKAEAEAPPSPSSPHRVIRFLDGGAQGATWPPAGHPSPCWGVSVRGPLEDHEYLCAELRAAAAVCVIRCPTWRDSSPEAAFDMAFAARLPQGSPVGVLVFTADASASRASALQRLFAEVVYPGCPKRGEGAAPRVFQLTPAAARSAAFTNEAGRAADARAPVHVYVDRAHLCTPSTLASCLRAIRERCPHIVGKGGLASLTLCGSQYGALVFASGASFTSTTLPSSTGDFTLERSSAFFEVASIADDEARRGSVTRFRTEDISLPQRYAENAAAATPDQSATSRWCTSSFFIAEDLPRKYPSAKRFVALVPRRSSVEAFKKEHASRAASAGVAIDVLPIRSASRSTAASDVSGATQFLLVPRVGDDEVTVQDAELLNRIVPPGSNAGITYVSASGASSTAASSREAWALSLEWDHVLSSAPPTSAAAQGRYLVSPPKGFLRILYDGQRHFSSR